MAGLETGTLLHNCKERKTQGINNMLFLIKLLLAPNRGIVISGLTTRCFKAYYSLLVQFSSFFSPFRGRVFYPGVIGPAMPGEICWADLCTES